ncbi:MAG: hypothetical protein ACKOXP_08440 [Flavobacteriales bacterium]
MRGQCKSFGTLQHILNAEDLWVLTSLKIEKNPLMTNDLFLGEMPYIIDAIKGFIVH